MEKLSSRILFCVIGFAAMGMPAWAVTYVGGDITSDATWDLAGSPYVAVSDVVIFNGARVTVEPGVVVRLRLLVGIYVGRNENHDATDWGALTAVGTLQAPITFEPDGSFDGGPIVFDGSSPGPMDSSLVHCTIDRLGGEADGALVFYGSPDVRVYRCRILNSVTKGICCDGAAHPSIEWNHIEGCGDVPVKIASEHADALSRNTYWANSYDAILLQGDITRDVTWPNEGPPYYPTSTITVYNGATLTISPGVRVGLYSGQGINVGRSKSGGATDAGGLNAVGTPDQPILFYPRVAGYFGAIRVDGRGSMMLGAVFKHCVFDLGGGGANGAVEVYSNEVVGLHLCTIARSQSSGVYLDASGVRIKSCIVSGCSGYGVRNTNGGEPLIKYTDAWGNSLGNWQGVTTSTGCISQNPLFYSSSDFRLQGGSPCIDTGDPSFDVGDGTRADMGAYQYGGSIGAPGGFFNAGWNWFSIPLVPAGSSEASDVLGFGAANILYRWNAERKTFQLYPYDFSDLEVKQGYVLRLAGGAGVTYGGLGHTASRTIPIPFQGVTMIGLPGLSNVPLADMTIRNLATDEERTAWEDFHAPVQSRWMNWNWVYWDSVGRTARICSITGDDDDRMRPWYGYCVWTSVDDLELVLP
jgi:hypothetical protein